MIAALDDVGVGVLSVSLNPVRPIQLQVSRDDAGDFLAAIAAFGLHMNEPTGRAAHAVGQIAGHDVDLFTNANAVADALAGARAA